MSMFDRLEDTLRRYEDVTAELGNPDIVTDQDKFRKYMKEQSNLAPIVEAYTEYKASKQNIEDSLQMISEESDEELLEMAREELADSKKKVHDPVLALDGDTDGLKFYKAITKQSVNYLKENGYLCYEIGYNQAEDVRNIMEQCGYSGIKVIKDLAGLDRVVIGRLNNIN